jgi:hypothetical protein
MSPQQWSWLLAVLGICGMVFVGRKKWQAFIWLIGVECLWIVFSIQTGQHGFILGSVAYGAVYANNVVKWRKADRSLA